MLQASNAIYLCMNSSFVAYYLMDVNSRAACSLYAQIYQNIVCILVCFTERERNVQIEREERERQCIPMRPINLIRTGAILWRLSTDVWRSLVAVAHCLLLGIASHQAKSEAAATTDVLWLRLYRKNGMVDETSEYQPDGFVCDVCHSVYVGRGQYDTQQQTATTKQVKLRMMARMQLGRVRTLGGSDYIRVRIRFFSFVSLFKFVCGFIRNIF